MSRSTPRKTRGHRNQPGGGGSSARGASAATNATSDYESDLAHHVATRPAAAVGPALDPDVATAVATAALQGSPSDLVPQFNFAVLRRYMPALRAITCSAPTAQAYAWNNVAGSWVKQNMEGPLFTCELEPPSGTTLPHSCLFLLNRKGLENMAIDLMHVSDLEPLEGLLSFRMDGNGGLGEHGAGELSDATGDSDGLEHGAENARRKVMGIWIHPDEPDRREVNHSVIMSAWTQSRASRDALQDTGGAGVREDSGLALQTAAPATGVSHGAGRRISISELFGQRDGNS